VVPEHHGDTRAAAAGGRHHDDHVTGTEAVTPAVVAAHSPWNDDAGRHPKVTTRS
jgi:hypothetical protein